MDTPGKLLKAEREKKGKSLKKLAKLLKIRVDYLKAIEDEDYGRIPGEVFIKGYIRVYADVLGLNSNHILKLYKNQVTKAALSERPVVVGIDLPTGKAGSYRAENKIFTYKPILIIAGVFLIIISLIVFITREEKKPVAKSVRLVPRIDSHRVPERVEEKEVEATLGIESHRLRGRDRPVPRDPLRDRESEVLVEKVQERFSLKIAATELTWISVSVDNNKPIVRFLKPGEVVKWTALNGFSVKIGNAAGAKLTFNGEDLGNLGPHGKIVTLILPEDKSTQKRGG